MVKKRWVGILIISFFGLTALTVTVMVIWATRLNNTIRERLAGKRWAAPTEYYSAPERFIKGQSEISKTLKSTLDRLDYRIELTNRALRAGEYAQWTAEQCAQKIPAGIPEDTAQCLAIKPRKRIDHPPPSPNQWTERPLQVLAVNAHDVVLDVFEGDPPQIANVIELEPELFAQFYGGQPVLRKIVTLGDVPPHLLNAILAIEDSNFLFHYGVSWTGMLRAAARNLIKGGVKEGGSTITQQLIKNYFLTSERTFKRKITEIMMALLLESQFTKDDILETYINEVYLGQATPFEIHGVGVAAKHFFNKKPDDLTLGESAVLAGSIQSPNRLSPISHPEKAIARRNVVLSRMLELKLISQAEHDEAKKETLNVQSRQVLRDLAPFFIDAVGFQLKKMGLPDGGGLQVFTTLNMRAQQAATDAVAGGLAALEKNYASIQKLQQKAGAKLQAVLIAADPTNGFVEAVVGGRSYGETQLNRAVQSRRQVGSIFKPFVFLGAFSSQDNQGAPFTPLTPILDEPFTVNYDRQTWSPQNYDGKYGGNVSLYQALENSLNASTAKIALKVGLQKVADVAKRAGVDSPITPVPSIALGTPTLTPLEVLQAYSTLARRGELNPLTFIYRVMTLNNEVLYEFTPARTQALDPVETRQVISLMEGVIERGTGRSIRSAGFMHPVAGKTGTTNDTKDAWFGGFTPLHAAVVWVGMDQPQETHLTGATGAIPIWTNYMRAYAARYPPVPFQIPEGAVEVTIDPDSAMVARDSCPNKVKLVFKKGTEPNSPCWLSH